MLVIHNPTAGWRLRRRYRDVMARLRRGATVTERDTAGRGDAEAFAAEAVRAGEVDVVLAAGGDGTINEVVTGLLAADGGAPVLGVIPLGTANVLAAEIDLSAAPADIAATALHGPARAVTVGMAEDARGRRAFVQMAGAGFDALVVEGVRPGVKRLLGKGAYALESLRRWLLYRPTRYRVTVDGAVHEVASVVVANGHYYGGRFVCAPGARLDAPTLELCLFKAWGRLAVSRFLLAMLAGRLSRLPDVDLVQGREILIEGPEGEPVQGDGDVIARLPVRITTRPAALRLACPRRA